MREGGDTTANWLHFFLPEPQTEKQIEGKGFVFFSSLCSLPAEKESWGLNHY